MMSQLVSPRQVALVAMTFLLLASALAQVNDPDPELWLPLYGLPALLCVAELARGGGPALRWAWASVAGVALAVGAHAWSAFAAALAAVPSASALLKVEVAREMGGLVLLTVWAALSSFVGAARSTCGGAAALAVPTTALVGLSYYMASGTTCGIKS